mgnify:CR=1 FL=1
MSGTDSNKIRRKETGYFTTPEAIARLMLTVGEIFDPDSVIDIACGEGSILKHCKYAKSLTGIDINQELIQFAQNEILEAELIVADSLHYPFNRKYDLVISHIPFGAGYIDGNRRGQYEKLFTKKALVSCQLCNVVYYL